jgi:bifunctional non-homologous end joining protein LigD
MLNISQSKEQITLYYREGASDKVYQAALEPKQDGYVVNFAYGRRGSTLTTGTKTAAPVAYERAKQLYDKLVSEKMAKGYTPGADGTPYRQSDKRATGILPQLLNTIYEGQLGVLLNDQQHVMQEKHDGRRLMLRKQDNVLAGINKLGLLTGFPAIIADECHAVEMDFIVDGEIVGDQYHAFDLLELGGIDLRGYAYQTRYLYLVNLLASFQHTHISLVESASEPRQKRELFERLKADNREGVVFKRSDAVYVAGRPHSGGSQLKFKFHETASFIVDKVNRKRSVSLTLLDGEKVVSVGNVTIPPNHDIPRVGACVEARYLYAHRGGCIFQPVYLGVRDDIRAEECVIGQLKYKS